jgi:hypothetical protein
VLDKPRGKPTRRAIGRVGDDVIGERGVVSKKVMSAAPVAALKAEGLGATEIAKRLGIGRASVYRVLPARAVADYLDGGPKGIDHRICGGGERGKDDRATLTEARARCGVRFVTTKDVAPIVAQLRAEGATSLRQVAEGLNARGVPAPKGGRWSAVQVIRAQARMRLSGPRRMS